MANANKWIGGTLIAVGGLTDVGAATQPNPSGLDRVGGLVVGTAAMLGGFWLWNEQPLRGQRRSRYPRSSRPR